MDLEEDAKRVLGLPLDIRAVKDECLGDVGEGPSSSSLSSCIATSTQEPVREVGGRQESGEEHDVVNLVEAITEAAVDVKDDDAPYSNQEPVNAKDSTKFGVRSSFLSS